VGTAHSRVRSPKIGMSTSDLAQNLPLIHIAQPHSAPIERVLIPDVEGRQFRNLFKSCHEYVWNGQVALADVNAPLSFERQHHISKWDWDPRITTPGKSIPIMRLHHKFRGTVQYVSHPSLFPFDSPEIRLCFRSKKWTTSCEWFLHLGR
jgi:hypothetical protein